MSTSGLLCGHVCEWKQNFSLVSSMLCPPLPTAFWPNTQSYSHFICKALVCCKCCKKVLSVSETVGAEFVLFEFSERLLHSTGSDVEHCLRCARFQFCASTHFCCTRDTKQHAWIQTDRLRAEGGQWAQNVVPIHLSFLVVPGVL